MWQTELSIILARAAKIAPAIVVCEMLEGETGFALSKEVAMRYAEDQGLAFVASLPRFPDLQNDSAFGFP